MSIGPTGSQTPTPRGEVERGRRDADDSGRSVAGDDGRADQVPIAADSLSKMLYGVTPHDARTFTVVPIVPRRREAFAFVEVATRSNPGAIRRHPSWRDALRPTTLPQRHAHALDRG